MTREIFTEYKNWLIEVNGNNIDYLLVGGEQQDLVMEDWTTINNKDDYKFWGIHIFEE